MDREQIEKWARECKMWREWGIPPGACCEITKLTRFARLAEASGYARGRAAALEEAAKVASTYEPRCDVCPSGVTDAITALAAKEPQP